MGQVPHAWDIRADWRSPDPTCSAIMTRGYDRLDAFPAWFYNLPPVRIGQAAQDITLDAVVISYDCGDDSCRRLHLSQGRATP